MAWWQQPAFYTPAFGLLTAFISGSLAFVAGRRKLNAETDVILIGGFKDLMKEFRTERAELGQRIVMLSKRTQDLEFDRKVLERRVDQLELTLLRNNIDVPPIIPAGK